MGQVSEILNNELKIDNIKYTPIYSYIQKIVPWLKSRYETAKRYSKVTSIEDREFLIELIHRHDEKIKEILNILLYSENNQNKD